MLILVAILEWGLETGSYYLGTYKVFLGEMLFNLFRLLITI